MEKIDRAMLEIEGVSGGRPARTAGILFRDVSPAERTPRCDLTSPVHQLPAISPSIPPGICDLAAA